MGGSGCCCIFGLAEWPPVGEKLFVQFTVCVFRGRLLNFVCVLLSLLVLRVGCRM